MIKELIQLPIIRFVTGTALAIKRSVGIDTNVSTSTVTLTAFVHICAVVSFALESRGTFTPVRSRQVVTGALTRFNTTLVDIDTFVTFQFVTLVAFADISSRQIHTTAAAFVIGAFVNI